MVVLEAPSKERAAGGGSASPTSSAVAIAADTAVAAAAAEAAVAAAKGAAAKGAAAAVTATQLASHSEEQGEVVSPDAASFSAPPTCTPAGGAARPALISKSLSFSSTMAGRFSAVKPSKPTPFSMLARYKSGSAGSSSSGNADGRTEMAACSSSALAAAAAMAEMEAEASASVDPASAAGKPADERLVIRVQATAGSAAVAAAASAWPPTPVNTPSAASKAAAPLATAADDLIRAALPNGNAVSTPRSTTDSSGHNGARSSFAAVIKRKLSSAGSKGFSLFAPSAALDGSKDEGSAVAIAAAVAAANGRSRATGKGVGTIAAVQAPSMQQLLAPVAGGRPATPTSGSRLASLVRFGRKKHSLASASAMQVAAAAGADGADAGSAPVQP